MEFSKAVQDDLKKYAANPEYWLGDNNFKLSGLRVLTEAYADGIVYGIRVETADTYSPRLVGGIMICGNDIWVRVIACHDIGDNYPDIKFADHAWKASKADANDPEAIYNAVKTVVKTVYTLAHASDELASMCTNGEK